MLIETPCLIEQDFKVYCIGAIPSWGVPVKKQNQNIDKITIELCKMKTACKIIILALVGEVLVFVMCIRPFQKENITFMTYTGDGKKGYLYT